jgi:hypothetical protein
MLSPALSLSLIHTPCFYQSFFRIAFKHLPPMHTRTSMLVSSLHEIKSRHDTGGIPAKPKKVPNQHGSIDKQNGSNGEQKDLGMGQKGQTPVSQVGDIPVPREGGCIKGIGNQQGRPALTQDEGEGKELKAVCLYQTATMTKKAGIQVVMKQYSLLQ